MKNKTKQKISQSLSIKFFLNSQKNFTKIFHQIFKQIKYTRQDKAIAKDVSTINLDTNETNKKTSSLKKIYRIYLTLTLIIFIYFIFNVIMYSILSAIICLSITIFLLSQAFKYHFYITQLKYKKLDLTLQEWISIIKKDIRL